MDSTSSDYYISDNPSNCDNKPNYTLHKLITENDWELFEIIPPKSVSFNIIHKSHNKNKHYYPKHTTHPSKS